MHDHIRRLKDGVNNTYTLGNLADWIVKHTKIEGKPFSFKGHEYQKDIIGDLEKNLIVVKAAQTGLSEIFARWALACVSTQENFTLMWTFPTSTDAENFTRTRIDPIIADSAEIRRMMSKSINTVALKQFGANSFAYVRGTISETGGLSVPADLLIHDEYDKSDMDNIATYVSRLQHKPTKMRRVFSTPTVEKYGVSLLAETAKRYRQMWKCDKCNHLWLPSYEKDVKIPGWDRPKKEITKTVLKDLDWQASKLLCPCCGREPRTDLKYRNWVLENPGDNYDEKALYVSPFCAPSIITPAYLVRTSATFAKWSEFCNQALGLTAEDGEESLLESDVRKSLVDADFTESTVHFLGADMGLTCHVVIGRIASDGKVLVVHRERINYTKFIERRQELCKQFRVTVSVHDMFPYTDLVNRITTYDPNAYGAIYVDRKVGETYTVTRAEAEPEEGKLNVTRVNINRDISFDGLMAEFKALNIAIKKQPDDEEFVSHLRDMKRVRVLTKDGFKYKWEKTKGEDHYHHALHYFYIATKLAGTASGWVNVGALPMLTVLKPRRQQ